MKDITKFQPPKGTALLIVILWTDVLVQTSTVVEYFGKKRGFFVIAEDMDLNQNNQTVWIKLSDKKEN